MILVLVSLGILIQLLAAIILQHAALTFERVTIVVISYLFLAFFLHFFRFIARGWIYKKYDLSYAYPFTSLFPIIYIVALVQKTATLSSIKVLAISLILAGITIVHRSEYKRKLCHVE